MSGRNDDVLVVTPDAAVVAAVESALASNGRAWSRSSVQSMHEMAQLLQRSVIPVVLVDLDPQAREILSELERIGTQHPETRFVALSSVLEQGLLLSAMESGVRHVLLKQQIREELARLLHRMATAGMASAVKEGNLFVVLSAGGGCGASTVAVNVADELGLRSGRPALLIDLDLSYGSLATILGVEAKYGIDYVLAHTGTIDAHLISSAATPYSEHLHLLPGPSADGFTSSQRQDFSRLEGVLDAAMEAYENVVIDAPRVSADMATVLVSASTRSLLAMQLTVKDTRMARAMLATLAQRGIHSDAVVPLVTRYARRQHMVSLEDVSKALGGAKIECIRNDYQGAARSTDLGKTLAAALPRSPLRKDFQELASKIAPAVKAQRG